MKILYYDCFSGISGDMNLGAMIDLGIDPDRLRKGLKGLGLSGYELQVLREKRRGIAGTRVFVTLSGDRPRERSLTEITALIGDAELSEAVKARSLDMFRRMARAEARIHDIDMDAVHFHEIGAVDAIVDIVGASLCLEFLAVDRVLSSPVELGGGSVACAHGTLPVPAPATVEILRGIPVTLGKEPYEMTTPTGAAILASVVDAFPAAPAFRPVSTGYGIGSRDTETPNVLRVMVGETDQREFVEKSGEEELFLVACTIDDMNPECYEYVMERLFEEGALDVFLTPVIMKKSRPGVELSLLCRVEQLDALEAILFMETTTAGLRRQILSRRSLQRDTVSVATEFGTVRVKRTVFRDSILRWKPEYADCCRLARERSVPLRDIYDAVERSRLLDVIEDSASREVRKGDT